MLSSPIPAQREVGSTHLQPALILAEKLAALYHGLLLDSIRELLHEG
jgi:hypothetical protein